jgi:hypothetical protein
MFLFGEIKDEDGGLTESGNFAQGGRGMILVELLRRYPFFGKLGHEQLKTLAMIGEEVELKDG